MTAAAAGVIGKLRHDPFAMLPFCGYNMGDYFEHWLSMEKRTDPHKLPKIFYVNWFRKNAEGAWLWPGYGENSRVLKWIFERCDGENQAIESPVGYLPAPGALDIQGLSISQDSLDQLFHVDKEAWQLEVKELKEYLKMFNDRLPEGIKKQLSALETRLK